MVAVRFANRAATDPATWTTTNYSGKNSIAVGQPDPFGGQQAGVAAATTETPESLDMTGSCSAVEFTPHIGDWIVGGVWVKSSPGGYSGSPTDAISLTYCGNPALTYSYSTRRGGQIQGDCQWPWQLSARKGKSGQEKKGWLARKFA